MTARRYSIPGALWRAIKQFLPAWSLRQNWRIFVYIYRRARVQPVKEFEFRDRDALSPKGYEYKTTQLFRWEPRRYQYEPENPAPGVFVKVRKADGFAVVSVASIRRHLGKGLLDERFGDQASMLIPISELRRLGQACIDVYGEHDKQMFPDYEE